MVKFSPYLSPQKFLSKINTHVSTALKYKRFKCLANKYHVKNIEICKKYDFSIFNGFIDYIYEYYIDKSNKELTSHFVQIWMVILNYRDFNEKCEFISNLILQDHYEEYEIDVNIYYIV